MGYAISFVVVLLAIVAALTKPESSNAWVNPPDTRASVPGSGISLKEALSAVPLALGVLGSFVIVGLFALIAVGLLVKLLAWLF